ncbi:MAG: aminoacyl-tRNA hydrolase [Flavobacteriales bacterium]|nr:aminoacyl-tRNA hydrolase [Flavobacteriales bacterium]
MRTADWLICGLGNPGAEYEGTRHNAGFDVLDILARRFGATFRTDSLGQTASVHIKGRPVMLLKPNTYMNESGKAVQYYLNRFSLPASHLLVISDDVALPVGTLRLRQHGSSGGHRGLASIEEYLGHRFWNRLRIGVGNNYPRGRQSEYVLSPPAEDELPRYKANLERAADAVVHVLTHSFPSAMNAFNGPLPPSPPATRNHGVPDTGGEQSQ